MSTEHSSLTATEAVNEVANSSRRSSLSDPGHQITTTTSQPIPEDVQTDSSEESSVEDTSVQSEETSPCPATTNSSLSCVSVALTSEDIYCQDESKRLYVGKLKQIPPPEPLEKQWINEVLPRLAEDLAATIRKLPEKLPTCQKMVEPELCMAGYALESSDTVELLPTIWLRCGGGKCQEVVESVVSSLTYLHDFVGDRIEIRCRGAYSVDIVPVDLSYPTASMVDGGCGIHLHLQQGSQVSTACGMRLMITASRDDEVVAQQSSTIGGLIRVHEPILEPGALSQRTTLYGLTTGHGIVDLCASAILDDENPSDSEEVESQSETDSDDGSLEDSSDEDEPSDSLGDSYERELQKILWNRAGGLGNSSYCGNGLQETKTRLSSKSDPENNTDFALVKLGSLPGSQNPNTYLDPDTGHVCSVTGVCPEYCISPGPVLILARRHQVFGGQLLANASIFVSPGQNSKFCTRKIQVESPLPLGSSGSWVVRGSNLLGMVVSSHEEDPYVHMIPADKVFADIKRACGVGCDSDTVQLPCDYGLEEPPGSFVWGVPREPVAFFTGRRDILYKIQKALNDSYTADQRRYVITGIGGVGKSEICFKFVDEKRDEFACVIWLDVSSSSKAVEDLASLTAKLGSIANTLEEARDVLSSVTGPSLLILDNADDPDQDYRSYFPAGSNWTIILTSRNPESTRYNTVGSIELGPLSRQDSVKLLLRTAKLPENSSNWTPANMVVDLVEPHPFALIQAGFYVSKNGCSLTEYYACYRDRRQPLLEYTVEESQARYHDVYGAFEASASLLETRQRQGDSVAGDALLILHVMSLFDYSAFPTRLFQEAWEGARQAPAAGRDDLSVDGLSKDHVNHFSTLLSIASDQWDPSQLQRTLQRLASLSLVKLTTTDDGTEVISMHPLMHGWARDRQRQQRPLWSEITGSLLALIFHAPAERWKAHETLVRPHVNSFVANGLPLIGLSRYRPGDAQIGFCSASMLLHLREDFALHHTIGAIFRKLRKDPQQPTWEQLPLYKIAAMNLLDVGEAGDAIALWQRVQVIEERMLDAQHPDRLATQHELASAYQAAGNVADAVALLERIVQVKHGTAQGETQNLSLLASQHQLARAYQAHGRLADAVKLLEHVVRTQERALGPTHPKRLAAEHQLARAYKKSGEVPKAVALLERVVAVEQTTLADVHPDRLASQHELACAYYQNGQVEEAVSLLEHVVKVQETTLAPAHPDRVVSEEALKELLRSQSRAGAEGAKGGREEKGGVLQRLQSARQRGKSRAQRFPSASIKGSRI